MPVNVHAMNHDEYRAGYSDGVRHVIHAVDHYAEYHATWIPTLLKRDFSRWLLPFQPASKPIPPYHWLGSDAETNAA